MLWDSTFPSSTSDGPGCPGQESSAEEEPRDFEIHRLKGILALEDGSNKIIQAVRDVFEIRDADSSSQQSAEDRRCKIVLIGRGLGPSSKPWQGSFEAFLDGSGNNL